MNKAIYGILAAAALATIKKNSTIGGSNTDGYSIKSKVQSLFKKHRVDAALATVYSFIDFSETDEYQQLSLISNVDIPLSYPLQDTTSLVLSSPRKIERFSEDVAAAIIKSFGSEDLALIAWNKNAGSLVKSYSDYFSKRDYGVAYSLIMNSIYPNNLNDEDWYRLFRDSKTNAEGLVLTKFVKNQKKKKELNKEFITAWLKSKIEAEGEPLLKGDLKFNEIFEDSGTYFIF